MIAEGHCSLIGFTSLIKASPCLLKFTLKVNDLFCFLAYLNYRFQNVVDYVFLFLLAKLLNGNIFLCETLADDFYFSSFLQPELFLNYVAVRLSRYV